MFTGVSKHPSGQFSKKKLEPKPPLKSKVVNKRKQMQQKQVKYNNKGSKELKPFKSGDKVRVKQKDGKWKKAVVSKLELQGHTM